MDLLMHTQKNPYLATTENNQVFKLNLYFLSQKNF